MNCSFGVFPDNSSLPSAIFQDLEDAIAWALDRYGADKFSLRHWDVTVVERAERMGAPGPV